jgi:stearoyl-CoA desaturase (Delta-9 desaturase)
MPVNEKNLVSGLKSWLLNDDAFYSDIDDTQRDQIDVFRTAVFIALHLGCLAVFFVGVSWVALGLALFLYVSRMFFITAFYHRYFSHRTYQVSRPIQFFMALAGCTAGQRGPLWWGSHHREHHLKSDTSEDPHSPKNGMLNSHTLWFLKKAHFSMRQQRIRDMMKYPELLMLERVDWLPFMTLAASCFALGELLSSVMPSLATSGAQLLVWGFFVSTIALYHATYTINSLCHRYGRRRFNTGDDSRNNLLLALLTLGEGWHNNHHRYPASTRQGFYWWEIDLSYFGLWLLSKTGLVYSMRPVPVQVMQEAEKGYKR